MTNLISNKKLVEQIFFEICDKLDYSLKSTIEIKQDLDKFINKNMKKAMKNINDYRGMTEKDIIVATLADMYLDKFYDCDEYCDIPDDPYDFI